MVKKIKFPVPKDDIPAWFMTYSDVITLLMTFFILLLTFATTEPERFEKVQSSSLSATGGATGLVGKKMKGPTKDSWITRVRPPASRIAMRGAEMPPITREPAKETFGKGLQSLDPKDRKHNEMTSHFFDVDLNRMFDSQGELTSQGKQICRTLATQLKDLPFQASFQFTVSEDAERIAKLMIFMFDEEKTRPGQVSMNRVRNATLPPQKLRILIKRYLANAQ